jgi:hypothetical protein
VLQLGGVLFCDRLFTAALTPLFKRLEAHVLSAERLELSAPIWRSGYASNVPSSRRGNDIAKAMDYMLKRWSASRASLMTAASACRTTPPSVARACRGPDRIVT